MRKKILIVLGVLVAIVAVLAVIVALQPAEFRVERSATIAAPPEKVFAHINDFHKWKEWSPWEKLDPNAKTTFEGPESGKDAVFKWSGNDEVGEGSMTITESKPDEHIKIKLAFVRPMEDTADVEFHLTEKDDKTHVTWTMSGTNNFMEKAFCLFMDLEKMIGDDYEKGLANLRRVVEGERDAKIESGTPNEEKTQKSD